MTEQDQPSDYRRLQDESNKSGGEYLKWCLIINSGAIIAVLGAAPRLPELGIEAASIFAAIQWWMAGAAAAVTSFGLRYLANIAGLYYVASDSRSRKRWRIHMTFFALAGLVGAAAGILFLLGAFVVTA